MTTTYVVERKLPGLTLVQLQQAATVAKDTCFEFSNNGQPVQYVGSTYYDDGALHCTFKAYSKEVVQQVNEKASLPFDKIAPAVRLDANNL